MFFKIESWNFQHLFEKEFRETFQNFSCFRQFLFPFFLSVVRLIWNFARFHEILFQTDAENVSFLSWKTKKFYSLKGYEISQGWTGFNIILFTVLICPNFQQRFCFKHPLTFLSFYGKSGFNQFSDGKRVSKTISF